MWENVICVSISLYLYSFSPVFEFWSISCLFAFWSLSISIFTFSCSIQLWDSLLCCFWKWKEYMIFVDYTLMSTQMAPDRRTARREEGWKTKVFWYVIMENNWKENTCKNVCVYVCLCVRVCIYVSYSAKHCPSLRP